MIRSDMIYEIKGHSQWFKFSETAVRELAMCAGIPNPNQPIKDVLKWMRQQGAQIR